MATTETGQHKYRTDCPTASYYKSIMENDLRAIQGGIKDLLGVSASSLSVPSWKFPSKQAIEVDIEDALKSCAGAGAGEGKEDRQKLHFHLLELIIDR